MNNRFRKIRPEEIPEAREKFSRAYPWAPEPQWDGVSVKVRDGEVVAMYELQYRVLVNNFYAKTPADARDTMYDVDAVLRTAGIAQYELLVPKENERLIKALRRFGLTPFEHERPHVLFVVRRD